MTKIGYQRVSTTDQNTDRQELDVDRIFEDKASGKDADRPALKEMLAYIVNRHSILTPYRRAKLTPFVLSGPGAA